MVNARSEAATMTARRRERDFHGALHSTAARPKTIGASVLCPEG